MNMEEEETKREGFRSGYVALVGRPNAGKSTLLNRMVGEKIAAVSNKPQTTRHQIRGVITRPEGQIVLVDTPGVHQPGYLLNRRMMAAVHDALEGVDLVCLIRDASAPTGNGDRFVLDLVKQRGQARNPPPQQDRPHRRQAQAPAAHRVVHARARVARRRAALGAHGRPAGKSGRRSSSRTSPRASPSSRRTS